MICASIAEEGYAACARALKGLDFAEIRLDGAGLGVAEVAKLFSSGKKLIATCRAGAMGDGERKRLLLAAVDAGAEMVDIELEAGGAYREEIAARARARGCQVIISYHNYERTPTAGELEGIVKGCFAAGADIAKIACRAAGSRDCARLLGLLAMERPAGRELVVIGMGKEGAVTRIAAPLLGSPFTFASAARGRETAEGQIDVKAMKKAMAALQDALGAGK